MTTRTAAAAVVHLVVAMFCAFADDATWLPRFTSTFGWFILLQVASFGSSFICAQENRVRAVAIPVIATVSALASLTVVEGTGFSPGWWAAPLVAASWTVWIFWPSLLGVALGGARRAR